MLKAPALVHGFGVNTTSLCLVVGVLLATAGTSRADIGVIVNEPIGALGFFTRVGHTATYLSNICPDGSPVKMRVCRAGERGGVVSKYTPFSENEDYDWAIVPFDEYLYGFGSPELAPMIGTRRLQRAIERHNFGPLFSMAVTTTASGELPEGEWKATLATRVERTLYVFSIETTVAEDAAIVAAFNAAPNRSRFNFFYRNCSDQTKGIFDLIRPHTDTIGDRTGGITMQTPKGLAKALVNLALEHPGLHLRVRRYPQIPGTPPRSRDVLFPMENAYKSIAFAPYWFFGGFREVAVAAMFYHQVLSPFSMLESSRDFISSRAAQLTLEQRRLRQRQDEVRVAQALAESHGSEWSRLSELNAIVCRRLSEVRREKQLEVHRLVGSNGYWQELDREFQLMRRALKWRRFAPEELTPYLLRGQAAGQLSERLLRYFDARGDFYVDDAGRGPWISLPLADGEMHSTGLSTSHILAGDPRLAALVLAAVIDYNLHQTEARREDAEYIDAIFTLFRQASDMIGRQAE